MNSIKLIVGLANPGFQYARTRHNVGSWFVRRLATHYQKNFQKNSDVFGFTTKLVILGYDIILLIPDTFMNVNGKSVNAITKLYQIVPEQILVVHDDFSLNPGTAKFKVGGGNNGHNGIKNIISYFGNFKRLRIGIGIPPNRNKITNYVLNSPSNFESKLIMSAIEESIYCTVLVLKDGIIKAMNRLHTFNASNYIN
ncbi:MAG: aminoacyl-tRNA hydrolase [Candidatus Dasytiphilus stammeri]